MRGGIVAVLAAVGALAACGAGKPASFPDQDHVATAQKAWCAILGEMEVARETKHLGQVESGWRHAAACDAAYPTGSADFIARMTPCYRKHLEAGGDDALDSGAIMAQCTEEILLGADPGDTSGFDVVLARCEREERCEKVPQADCLQAFASLDGPSRTLFTSMYNLKAQGEIAACLRSERCTKDEDHARAACYAPAERKRVWFAL